MATIKAIENRSVHQIQSGQVIVDLISVVKELVENSLDAGATSIEVRLKNHGLDSIEVQDNGKGIAPEDFETVALKHHTSKLSTYEDLTSLDTFGFRGEALSSLCALSKFHIATARAEAGAVGKRLDFESSGKLAGTTVIASQKGTSVTVEDLFHSLPVRRKELEKNIKREYNKVLAHLQAYACISAGVRFAVSNQMPKAKKVSVFSTKANTTTKENITNVFGAKALLALVKLDLHLEMEPSNGPSTQSARNWSTQALDRSREVHVQGYISKPVFGEGRQAPDRQMYFVNSRPCGLPQVSKAVNEVYKTFNVSQLPFVFANLVMDTNAYDVNVSPDKRNIMLHDQTALLDSLKANLTELFERTDHSVPQSQLPNQKLPGFRPLTVPREPSGDGKQPQVDTEPGRSPAEHEEETSNGRVLSGRQYPVLNAPRSLIENWIGRDTDSRSQTPAARNVDGGASKEKQKLVKAMQKESEPNDQEAVRKDSESSGATVNIDNETADEDERRPEDDHDSPRLGVSESKAPESRSTAGHEPDPMGSPYDDLFSQRPFGMHDPLVDSKPSIDSTEYSDGPNIATPAPVPAQSKADADVDAQPPIHAVAPSSQKGTPGPVQNAFDRMRPKRTPLQTAEITIGDTTTTTVIGSSPPYKRRRIHQPHNSQAIAGFGGSPLLARGLRSFAAPGSQLDVDSSDVPRGEPGPHSSEDEDEPLENERVEKANEADHQHRNRLVKEASDAPTSDALDALLPAPVDDDEFDEDYVDEQDRKLQEDEKVARLIQEAEFAAVQPTEENLRRASQVLKNGGNRKESTLQLARYVTTSGAQIAHQLARLQERLSSNNHNMTETDHTLVKDEMDDTNAESQLSLTVSKADFERMHVIGQFNLGFIIAVRPFSDDEDEDELFIIDQHAADEKYNYERLQRTVTLQNQRLVRPKPLELTAIEEEIILNNGDALKANGFEIETTSYGTNDEDAGRSFRLITLPISGEKTFDLSDLEELLHLLSEAPAGGSEIPRPKKVQRMLAMRACRSSIMVGKTLTLKQMHKVVRHMGEMEKPWNCPHGRPTMRHLAGMGSWTGWTEGDVINEDDSSAMPMEGRTTDWKKWLEGQG